MSEKTVTMDPAKARVILELQERAIAEGVPFIVYADKGHMDEALKNQRLGKAVVDGMLNFYVPKQRYRL